jgi:hypothetical protein
MKLIILTLLIILINTQYITAIQSAEINFGDSGVAAKGTLGNSVSGNLSISTVYYLRGTSLAGFTIIDSIKKWYEEILIANLKEWVK